MCKDRSLRGHRFESQQREKLCDRGAAAGAASWYHEGGASGGLLDRD